MNNIVLTKDLILAKGGERTCYIHPQEEKKIIKILHSIKEHNHQNQLEYIYYQYLKTRKVCLSMIPQCYGWIETNLGLGLCFQRVLNYDGTDAQHFRFYLRNNILSEETEKKLLKELEDYLILNRILFIDVSTVNVFCQEIAKNEYKLIIFDGLGARRLGVKFYLYLYLPWFSSYKIKKQWKKFLANCMRDKNWNQTLK